MRLFLTGVSCVGKTTVGARVADRLDVSFLDLDREIERFFQTTIPRLQSRFLTVHTYREETCRALRQLLSLPDTANCVVALLPSSLMGPHWRVLRKTEGVIAVLWDSPENILQRITFYDIDSRPIEKELTEDDKRWYLRDIKQDITYLRASYSRAHLHVDISGLGVDDAAAEVEHRLQAFLEEERSDEGE